MKIRALEVLDRFIEMKPATVLDVGSGGGAAAKYMRTHGINVVTIDNYLDADVQCNYMDKDFMPREGIWCSHVLEHCFNVHETLLKFRDELIPNGVLAITVPPMRRALVGGHLNNFTPGTLIYNLIIAGFDCRQAAIYVDHAQNISVIVESKIITLPSNLVSGPGDLEKLARFFPCAVSQHMDGHFKSITNFILK